MRCSGKPIPKNSCVEGQEKRGKSCNHTLHKNREEHISVQQQCGISSTEHIFHKH